MKKYIMGIVAFALVLLVTGGIAKADTVPFTIHFGDLTADAPVSATVSGLPSGWTFDKTCSGESCSVTIHPKAGFVYSDDNTTVLSPFNVLDPGGNNISDRIVMSGVNEDDNSVTLTFTSDSDSAPLGTWSGPCTHDRGCVVEDGSSQNIGGISWIKSEDPTVQVSFSSDVTDVKAPEPGTLPMLGVGLVGLAGILLRKQLA